MIKRSIFLGTVLVIIIVLLISCSKLLTNEGLKEKKEGYEKKSTSHPYTLTLHEHILLEYDKRYDDSHYEKVFDKHLHQFIGCKCYKENNQMVV